jgi:anti-sigma B factor antagonist
MGSRPFTARVQSGNGVATIAFSGELDMSTVPVLEEQLGPFVGNGVATIKLDLRELTFVDSMGLSAFLRARHLAEANGQRLVLVNTTPNVRRLLRVTGLTSLLADEDDVGRVVL